MLVVGISWAASLSMSSMSGFGSGAMTLEIGLASLLKSLMSKSVSEYVEYGMVFGKTDMSSCLCRVWKGVGGRNHNGFFVVTSPSMNPSRKILGEPKHASNAPTSRRE